MTFAGFYVPASVFVWAALLVPFAARLTLAYMTSIGGKLWIGGSSPWDTKEADRGTGWRRYAVPPVVAAAQFIPATLIASVLVAVLAPWINGLPVALPLAQAASFATVAVAAAWLYMRLRSYDRRRREAARDYRTPGWDAS